LYTCIIRETVEQIELFLVKSSCPAGQAETLPVIGGFSSLNQYTENSKLRLP
jgi:hypothetical protein